jgi:hypothetical protein
MIPMITKNEITSPVKIAALYLALIFCGSVAHGQPAGKIDRKALVTRHNLTITDRNLHGPTQVGNGHFAFGFDITGLQTFSPDANTMSDWGWHKFAEPNGQTPADFKGQEWDTQGHLVRYDIQNPQQEALTDWMISNPQRLNLGRIGLILKKKDGSAVVLNDLQNPVQKLDMWTGISTSTFEIDGKQVKVVTIGNPNQDGIAVHIEAPGLNDGQIGVFLDFPYASHGQFDGGGDWNSPDKHQTKAIINNNNAIFHRTLDDTKFDIGLKWANGATIKNTKPHRYELTPTGKNQLDIVVTFSKAPIKTALPAYAAVKTAGINHWAKFWLSGGAIDLSASKDPRWMELERRIILSQYIMAVNEVGSTPPQESGLVNNGWFGKYHFEMIWWHEAHYALWGRLPLMDESMRVYALNLKTSQDRAKRQGYEGARWPKTVGDNEHWEWPNEINPLLIWQQPHPIFFAELAYRTNPTKATLAEWGNIVVQTADFMASYPYYNKDQDRYILGYPLQVVSENADPRTCYNPTFELSYWRTGLKLAQKWRKRLNMPANPKYAAVLAKLSKLPVKDGMYESWENITDMWTKYNFEHPALTGAYGLLPGDGVDIPTMEKTFNKVGQTWRFDRTWGWDFPMLAMCAARLGHGDKAIEYLLNYKSFDLEQHGLVGGGGPFPYFPGNGGLLYAVALMAAGWDGAPSGNAPGFPKDGQWVVKSEGLKRAL